MIFEKILKGTDLAFDITLDKTQYRPEEIVRGTIYLKTEKSSKARRLMLFAEGKESTIITVSENTGGGSSSRSTTTRTYSETDTFFSEDLSHFLQKSVSSNVLDEGILEISPQNKKIAFEFKLPGDDRLFSSYKGKNANITYAVKATVDIAKRLDVNKEEHFSVFNYNNKVVLYSSDKSSLNEEDKTATVSSSTIENEFPSAAAATETIEDSTSKESYSARFERLFDKKSNRTASSHGHPPSRSFTFSGTGINFDLGSIFAKGREHFLKENSEAKIDLLNHANNNTSYSPGHIIKGKVILLSHLNQEIEEKKKNKKIKGLKITLSGVENAFAQGRQRISTIEKYEKNIWLDEYGENNNRSVAFEFQIPDKVNQSYTGKYSEYFCGLEAKLNIAWSSDINARTIIEVVWLISAILEIVTLYDLSHDLANYILLRFILSKWVEKPKKIRMIWQNYEFCMLDKIRQSNSGEHNLILYQDVATLNNVYLEYCKNALETLNEMILILSYHGSVSNLFHSFKNIGVDVEKYKLQGLLVIVEAKKGYFSLTNELVDITIMIKMLLQRSNKLGKSGLTVFSDMGLFFHRNRLDELLKHETRLFMSSSWITNSKMKIFCCYNESDLKLLTDNQKKDLFDHHYRVIWAVKQKHNVGILQHFVLRPEPLCYSDVKYLAIRKIIYMIIISTNIKLLYRLISNYSRR